MGRLRAGVIKRSDGRYQEQFTFKGKRYTISGKSPEELADKKAKKLEELERGIYKANKEITLDEFFSEWLDGKRKEIRPASINLYKQTYQNIAKYLGTEKIATLERRRIHLALEQIKGEKGANMANKCRSLLYSIVKVAAFNNICRTNEVQYTPSYAVSKTQIRDDRHRALSKEELAIFFKYAQNSRYYPVFKFMLYTGLRAGECLALQWIDINESKGIFRVQRTLTKTEEGKNIIGNSPKTDAGKRSIPLIEKATGILQKQRAIYKMTHAQKNINDLVFTNEAGNAANVATLNTVIRQICKSINRNGQRLERFTTHAFRITFASDSYRAGAPVNVLKDLMGHESYDMTMDIYTRTNDEDKIKAMQMLIAKER